LRFAGNPPGKAAREVVELSNILNQISNVAITSDGETGIICLLQMRRSITVNDRMQRDYRYELVEPVGRNFDPEFKPDLTPAEMLRLGVFGGKYMTDCADEFPASWFKHAKLASGSRDNQSSKSLAKTCKSGSRKALLHLALESRQPDGK
jgi:hypothetical protein